MIFLLSVPPENITTSKNIVNVSVDHIPERVLCSAKAHPEPSFKWYREGSNEIITDSNSLSFDVAIPRRSTGNYICEAWNRHGFQTVTTYINVQCKKILTSFHLISLFSINQSINQTIDQSKINFFLSLQFFLAVLFFPLLSSFHP